MVRLHAGVDCLKHRNKQDTEQDEIYHSQCQAEADKVFGKLILIIHRVALACYLTQVAKFADEFECIGHLLVNYFILDYTMAKVVSFSY